MSITITPINTGMCTSNPKTYHYHHSVHKYYPEITNEDKALPVFTFLLNTGRELILVDTGMAWTERANQYHHPNSWQEEDQAIHIALERRGYCCDDISKIIFTHMHWDHTFYMGKFKNAVYFAQKKEYEFAVNPIPVYYKSYEYSGLGIEPPFAGLGHRFVLLDGEAEIVPGVRVFPTPGHSVGHQAVEVDTKDGTYIIAGDAAFLMDNFKEVPQLGYAVTPPSRFVDIASWWNSAVEIKRRASSPDMILLTHEPAMLERVAKTPVLGL